MCFRQGTAEKQIPLLCHDLGLSLRPPLGHILQSPDDVWCKFWQFFCYEILRAVFSFTEPISIRCLYQTVLLDSFVFTVFTLLPLFTFHSSRSWMLLLSIPFFLSSSFHICPSALNTVRFKPLNDQSHSTSLLHLFSFVTHSFSVPIIYARCSCFFSTFPVLHVTLL